MKLKARLFDLFIPHTWLYVRKKGGSKTLYLTFDDGPEKDVTPELLALLARFDVKATFFCIGEKIQNNQALAKEIINQGHTLANHSYYHRNFHQLSVLEQMAEVVKTNTLIEKISGSSEVPLFRTPNGKWQLRLLKALVKQKKTLVLWSLDSLDYFYKEPDDIVQRFEEHPPVAGDIILFHDDSPLCIKVLEVMLPKWKEMGFEMNAL